MLFYFELVKKTFKRNSIYKLNSYINVLSSIIQIIIQISIWSALYADKTTHQDMSLNDMITFVVITRIVISITSSNVSGKISQKINQGTIALDFIKPVKVKWMYFFEDLGSNLYNTIFTVFPVCLISTIFFDIIIPNSFHVILFFFASTILGIFLMYHINYLFGLTSFWLESGWGIDFVKQGLLELFGGTFVPLWYYPKPLYDICSYLPFKYTCFDPVQIYVKSYSIEKCINVIVFQMIWIVILLVIEKVIYRMARKRLSVVGG